jgi:hypothetical protein
VGAERHTKQIPKLAVKIADSSLRTSEHTNLGIALRREPLGENAQRNRLAYADVPSHQSEAAFASKLFDAPAERFDARRDIECLGWYLR